MLRSGPRRTCMSLLCSVMGCALRINGKRWRLTRVETSSTVDAGQHEQPKRSICPCRWEKLTGCRRIRSTLTWVVLPLSATDCISRLSSVCGIGARPGAQASSRKFNSLKGFCSGIGRVEVSWPCKDRKPDCVCDLHRVSRSQMLVYFFVELSLGPADA